jgi:TonB family protein
MYRPLQTTVTALLLTAGTLGAQANQTPPKAPQIDTLLGVISATLPSGAELRGGGATVYLWADRPELRTALEAACVAAHAQPNAWMAARTELETPGGPALDTTAAADLALLQRIVAIPHAEAHADSTGRFAFVDVPAGTFWIEAEMMQGVRIVQWWHRLSMESVDFAFARLFGQKTSKLPVKLVTQDFTHDQFCMGGEPPMGAAEFEAGRPTQELSGPLPDGAYTNVDEPATVIHPYPQPAYPEAFRQRPISGSVKVRFVIDSTGEIDTRTVHVIQSTDPEFTRAVENVLPSFRFRPARIAGRAVRWVTTQAFSFDVSSEPLSR